MFWCLPDKKCSFYTCICFCRQSFRERTLNIIDNQINPALQKLKDFIANVSYNYFF